MAKQYDVVIAGAGPAGLMAAKTAVESGMRIALESGDTILNCGIAVIE
jgi:flavin-dependent dehydrogenase